MPASFPSYLYSFVPGRGFGVTPRASHVYVPETCATYQPLSSDTSSWPTRPTATVIRLGPEPSRDAWINKERPGALLVMRGGNVHDVALHGFAGLDLWPLVGFAGSRGSSYPSPPIEVGALQVGLAVANAWEKNPRLAVEGPAWALGPISVRARRLAAGDEPDADGYWGRRLEMKFYVRGADGCEERSVHDQVRGRFDEIMRERPHVFYRVCYS